MKALIVGEESTAGNDLARTVAEAITVKFYWTAGGSIKLIAFVRHSC